MKPFSVFITSDDEAFEAELTLEKVNGQYVPGLQVACSAA